MMIGSKLSNVPWTHCVSVLTFCDFIFAFCLPILSCLVSDGFQKRTKQVRTPNVKRRICIKLYQIACKEVSPSLWQRATQRTSWHRPDTVTTRDHQCTTSGSFSRVSRNGALVSRCGCGSEVLPWWFGEIPLQQAPALVFDCLVVSRRPAGHHRLELQHVATVFHFFFCHKLLHRIAGSLIFVS